MNKLTKNILITAIALYSGLLYAGKGEFTNEQICKATIATVMSKDPSIINIDKVSGKVISLSYIRNADSSKWAYRCKTEGSKAIWASDTGRWRTHALDSKITFSANGNTLKVTEKYNDGSATKKSFSSKQLGG